MMNGSFDLAKIGDSFAKTVIFFEAPKSSCNGKALLALDHTYPFGGDLNSQSEAFSAISW